MKIAIISDTHFGFAYNTERKKDSFIQGEEAIEKAIEQGADLILLAGDIFDSRVPTQDVLGKVMKILLKPLTAKNKGVELVSLLNKRKEDVSKISFSGVPVVAIHGTHERRGRGLTNAIQVLEKAGLLIHLHCSSIVLKLNSQNVAIHGMSGVPEQYAREVLEKWHPEPVEGALNILMMHQSIGQYIYSETDIPTLNLEDLPQNFDLVINGHIHWSDVRDLGNGKFLIPGSTVRTQLRKIESEKSKGFFIFDGKESKFIKLETPRNFYYKTISVENISLDELTEKIESELNNIESTAKKPLVRLILKGTLKKGFETSDIDITSLQQKFNEKLMLQITKERIKAREIIEKEKLMEELKEKRLSMDELGNELLKKHLKELDYNDLEHSEELLNQLANENVETVYIRLKQNTKNG